MRCFLTVSVSLAFLLGLVGASHAQVTLFVTPTNQGGDILTPGALLLPGDQITFDIAARNDGTPINGLGVSAVGYDASGLAFVSGSGVAQLFADICIPGSGCFGGLDGSQAVVGALSESFNTGVLNVQIFEHISLTPATSTGVDDWGTSGIPGEAQARIVFDVMGVGSFQQDGTIAIGAFFELGDVLILHTTEFGTVETVWVVPEPSTALLMGLGLLGLGKARG